MKKRLLSSFLALSLCLSLFPAAVFAYDPETTTTGEVTAGEAGSTGVTGGGDAGGSGSRTVEAAGIAVSGAAWDYNQPAMIRIPGENAKEPWESFETYVSGYGGDLGPAQFYFAEEGLQTRRVTVFTDTQLDPAGITVGQGCELVTPFRETARGIQADEDRSFATYMYQGVMSFYVPGPMPAFLYYQNEDGAVGQLAAFRTNLLSRLENKDTDSPFAGEIYVLSASGNTLSMEINGLNLPVGEAAVGQYVINDSVGDTNAPIYRCTAYDAAASDPAHGVYVYTMTATGNEIQGNSWFSLTCGGEAVWYLAADEYSTDMQAWVLTLTPLHGAEPAADYDAQLAGFSTATGTGTVNITSSGYTQMRWKLGEDFAAGDSSGWTAIAPSVTVAVGEAVGTYTVYFQFRDEDGSHQTSKTVKVTRQGGSVLPAPVDAGILTSGGKLPARDDSGAWQLVDNVSYTLCANLPGGEDPSRRIAAEWNGAVRYLSWDASNERYELANVKVSGTSSITLRAEQLDTDASPHGAATLSVSVINTPQVISGTIPWISGTTYVGGAYTVDPGASMHCSFVGDSGEDVKGWAVLNYRTGSSQEASTAPQQLSENSGTYSGTLTLPESDISALLSVKYYLTIGENQGRPKSYSLATYRITPCVTFEAFPASYDSASIELRRNGEYFGWYPIRAGQDVVVSGVELSEAGADYSYTINGSAGVIAKGTLSASMAPGGAVTQAALNLPALHTLSVTTTVELPHSTYLCFRRDANPALGLDEPQTLSLQGNPASVAVLEQIPAGTTGMLGILTYNNAVRGLKVGDAYGEQLTVDADLHRDAEVTLYGEGDTLSGHVYKPPVAGAAPRTAGGVYVSLRQELNAEAGHNGVLNARTLTASSGGFTGEDGSFSIRRPLSGEDAALSIRQNAYSPVSEAVGGGVTNKEITLQYRDKLVVDPRLMVEPMRTAGSGSAGAPEGERDNSPLYVAYLRRKGVDEYLYLDSDYNGRKNLYFINESNSGLLPAGTEVELAVGELDSATGLALSGGTSGTSGYRVYTGRMDKRQNLTLDITAQHLGAIQAEITNSQNMTGVLQVYKDWDNYGFPQLVAQASGWGTLTVDNLPAGSYTAVTMLYPNDYAESVAALSGSRIKSYVEGGDRSDVRVIRDLTVTNGVVNVLGYEAQPSGPVGAELLGDYVIRSRVEQSSADGTVDAVVWIEPITENPRPLRTFSVNRTSLNGTIQVDASVSATQYTSADSTYTSARFMDGGCAGSVRLWFQDKPGDGSDTVSFTVNADYYSDDNVFTGSGYATLNAEISVNRFELDVPARYLRNVVTTANGSFNAEASDPWTLPVVVTASPSDNSEEQSVTIYDDGTAVGTYQLTGMTNRFEIALSYPGEWILHEIYATRGGSALTTPKQTVNVADPDKEIYANHIIWWHRNDRGKQQWNFETLNDIGGKTIRYYPAKRSCFAFAIANAQADELENVRLACSYLGNPEYNRYYAQPITQEDFIRYWNQGTSGKISAEDFSDKGKGVTYSYWFVDEQSSYWYYNQKNENADFARTAAMYPRENSAGRVNVDTCGLLLHYFKGFTVKYDYVGKPASMTLAALLPKRAETWAAMSDSTLSTMLDIIDYTDQTIAEVSLDSCYRVADPSTGISAFATNAKILAKKNGTAEEQAALAGDLQNFLRSETDDLPPFLRDTVNSAIADNSAGKVAYQDVSGDDARAQCKEALALDGNELLLDAFKVTLDCDDSSGTDRIESTVSLSTVNITSESFDEEQGGGNWLNTTDKSLASYVDPDSVDAVRWLMNYERDKKYNGTAEEQARYQNVTWTHYETAQGTVFERSEAVFTPGEHDGLNVSYKTDTYLPDAAVEKLIGRDTLDNLVAAALVSDGEARASLIYAGAGSPFSREKIHTGMKRFETLSNAYTYLGAEEEIRHSYNTYQIVKNGNGYVTKGFASELADGQRAVGSKIGTTMNVVGAAVTLYNISQGPQGGNEDVLLNNLHRIKDDGLRQELQQDVLDYVDRKGQLYLGESFTGAVNSGASFSGNKAVQGATFLATLYAAYKGKVAHEDLDAEYSCLLSRMSNLLSTQAVREARADAAASQATIEALRERLQREGFEGYRLDEEMSKFNLVRSASGEFGYVPMDGWGQITQQAGYVPEQPDPNKFEVDWGPSFGGQVPTAEQLAAFYGTDGTVNEIRVAEYVAQEAAKPRSLEDLINKVETDLATASFRNCYELEDELADFTLYIDPSGFVFEAVEENRVPGITATLYQGAGSSFTQWTDTNADPTEVQENPQTTADFSDTDPDAAGRYGWMTPAGTWKVKFTDPKHIYADTETTAMTVPPEHTQVNIGLVSNVAPKVAVQTSSAQQQPSYNEDHKLSAYADRMTVIFDKWMQLESIVSAAAGYDPAGSFDSEYAMLKVTDAAGNIVPGKVSFPNFRLNTGYRAKAEGQTYQTYMISADTFVRTLTFQPDSNFTKDAPYTLLLSGSVKSYAGVPMGANFSATVNAPEQTAPHTFTVTFVPANGGADILVDTNPDGTVKLPADPDRSGYTFLGWFKPDGEQVTGTTQFTENTTVTARWKETPADPGNGGNNGNNNGSNRNSGGSYSGGSGTGGVRLDQTISIPITGASPLSAVAYGTVINLEQLTGTEAARLVEKNTGSATLDLSNLGRDVTAVVLSTQTMQAMAQAVDEAGSLTIRLPDGTAVFDAGALAAIAAQAKDTTIWFNLDRIDTKSLREAQRKALRGKDVQQCYDIYLTSGGVDLGSFPGGTVTLSLNYTLKSDQTAEGMEVWYVSDDGKTVEEIPAVCESKTVKIAVHHFSCYAIASGGAPEAVPCPQDSTCPVSRFTDADAKAWYHDCVHWALEKQVMNGTGDGRFDPNGTTTRAMVATMLWRLEGSPATAGASGYSDVDAGSWYAPAVRWARAGGIVTGYDDPNSGGKVFAPDAPVTREQLAAMLYRYAQSKGHGFTGAWMFLLDYPDAASVSDWADEAIHWMTMHGIVTGIDGRLAPQESATRAQVATMLARFCENLAL